MKFIMEDNKSLQIRKENVFSKVINFFKSIFHTKKYTNSEATINNIKTETIKNEFLNGIRLERQEDPDLLKLQKQFESREIDLRKLSNDEIHNLKLLYKRQVSDLKQKLEDKKSELNMLKYKVNGYRKSSQ